MGKVIVLNGSPRKNNNTAKLLIEAARGAESAGADVEYFNLVDLNYKGCMSCFACKLKGATTNGVCAYHDDLTPILEKIVAADAVIIGSPIYYSYQTGMFRNLVERMLFATTTYNIDISTGFTERVLPRKIPVGLIYTMNVTEENASFFDYPAILAPTRKYLGHSFGHVETLCVYDTYQFNDYSKYECDMFDEEHKAIVKETQFPIDLQKAYNLGRKLVNLKLN